MAKVKHRQAISKIPSPAPGQIRTVLCGKPVELMAAIELSGFPDEPGTTCSMCRFDALPEMDGLLTKMLRSLARVAAALFPRWYDGELEFDGADPLRIKKRFVDDFSVYAVALKRPRISSLWLQEAVKCCIMGKLPLPEDFTRELQAAQLAMAIGGEKLLLVPVVEDHTPPPERVLGLAKAAEWFTRAAGVGVLVLAPAHFADVTEMQSILYDAAVLHPPAPAAPPQPHSDEAKHALRPFLGKPHPFSPGEQLLAEALERTADLAGLFVFNRAVTTARGRRFVVDLLWEAGRVVVEVDGYGCHGSRYAFEEDRNRDYELMISGFLVLRLTHDEIVRDVAVAVDKIRDVVRFRRQQDKKYEEAP